MIYSNSRYLYTRPITRIGWNKPTLEIRKRFTFNELNYTSYIWTQGDTLDGVTTKVYGIPDLRWAIMDANPQYRTEWDIKNGDVINIPNYDEVVELVNV